MAFITVFGKTSGESPSIPRSRNPSAKVSEERKSPQWDPSTSPIAASWPGWRPASARASRAATTASWLARDSRRASPSWRCAAMSPTSPPSRLAQPSVGKAWTRPDGGHASRERLAHGGAVAGAERAHAPDPGHDDPGPGAAARAQPSPSRPRGRGDAPEQEAQVLAAEPEGVRQGALDRAGRATLGTQSKITSGSGSVEVGGGRDEPVDERQHGRDPLQRAGRRHRVPHEGLVRAHEHRVGVEQLAERRGLDTVVLRRARSRAR